ncbi:hypothetical protein CVT25_015785 [Psilocybe cyanescens]|uniref:Uncharacterized protein n=1 Tax=Psilocybe cyanescens TaxID=93625 RepID=A0A409X1G9_PSICY|nr:hypothetical protein CVT25_015785 [Psilocybe cyanescens]
MEREVKPNLVMADLPGQIGLLVETIGVSSSGTPPGPGESSTDVEMHDASQDPQEYRSPERFFEDLIISRAPEEVRSHHRPKAPTTPEQIEEYRKKILNDPSTKHRFVFQQWPRDPNGTVITPLNSQLGKVAGNAQQIWGSTLFDFYTVRRIPSVPNLMTYTSGSKLAKWMQSQGETFSQDLVEKQKSEEEPATVQPCDIGKLIKRNETMFINSKWSLEKSWSKEEVKDRFELPKPWPPASPFSPSAYPSPWPFPPFSQQHMTRIPTLQQYIPQSLLPERLIVHDPWKLLAAEVVEVDTESEEFRTEKLVKWNEKEDVTHIYRLQNSEANSIRRKKDNKALEKQEEDRHKVRRKFLADPHTRNELPDGFVVNEIQDTTVEEPGPVKPPIYVVFPLRPSCKQPEEAHLYIAPAGSIGEGHHSFVYKTELELPRSFLVNEEICEECVLEDMGEILREQDGPNGDRRDPKWDEKSGKLALKTTEIHPEVTRMADPIHGEEATYIIKPGKYSKEFEYEGPFRVIESRVKYPNLEKGPYCTHIQKEDRAIHPLTSKVYVAAKLSKQGDGHLAAEAENYQKFPDHFFEHWTGYNILRPMHDPVPLGALVPQFYGYYVLETRSPKLLGTSNTEEEGREDMRSAYLSPLLLLEDCGHPIDPRSLSVDDRNQSGSLIYRFHEEGWLHGSVARRNILRQPGPITAWPSERAANALKRGGLGQISASLSAMQRTIDDYDSMTKREIIKAKQEKAQMRVQKFRADYADLRSQFERLRGEASAAQQEANRAELISASSASASLSSPSDSRRRFQNTSSTNSTLHPGLRPQNEIVSESPFRGSTPQPGMGGREFRALDEHSFIQNTDTKLDEFLAQGREVLDNLRDQRNILKGTQRRLLDTANTLGLSRNVIGWIEKRSTQDTYIFLGGAVFTFFCFYLIWRYLG